MNATRQRRGRPVRLPVQGAWALCVACLLWAASCASPPPSPQASPVAPVTVSAASAAAPLLASLIAAYEAHTPGATVIVEPGNAYHSLRQVVAGATDLGVVSLRVGQDLWTAPLALDAVAIVVHPDNPLTALSSAQLRDILSGRIWQWADLEIDGVGNEITVVSRESGSGTRLLVEAQVMAREPGMACQPRLERGERGIDVVACETEPVTPTAIVVTSSEAVAAYVASHPGAIGYLSRGAVPPGVSALRVDGLLPVPGEIRTSGYPILQPFQFVAPGEPSGAARAFVDFCLSAEGQAIVAQGYAPVRVE
ncbi:MAG: substrate-binding domain-containing protein [Anaerolineae bacterium]|nr:substrate-binding domain-containing protein [Anaerolineae bacterium]